MPNQSSQAISGLPLWVVVLGILAAMAPLSIDMYLPAFPAIAATLHTDAGSVQRTLSIFFVGLAFGQLLYGPIADCYGRKPPLYAGLTIYVSGALVCALAPTVETLQGGRLLQALGGCAGMVVARAVIRDRCSPVDSAKVMSLIILVMGAAPILAPLLGGLVLQWLNWRAIFGVLGVFGAICLIAIHFGMEESLDPAHATPLRFGFIIKTYGALLGDWHFLTMALCAGMAQASMFAYITGSPFVLIEHYGIPAQHYGWIFGCNAFALTAAAQINARLLQRFTPEQVLNYALSFSALVILTLLTLTLSGITGLPILLPALFCCVGVLGLINPNNVALAMQHQGARAGAASAMYGTLQLGSAAVASAALSLWHAHDELPLVVVMVGCICGAYVMFRLGAHQGKIASVQ